MLVSLQKSKMFSLSQFPLFSLVVASSYFTLAPSIFTGKTGDGNGGNNFIIKKLCFSVQRAFFLMRFESLLVLSFKSFLSPNFPWWIQDGALKITFHKLSCCEDGSMHRYILMVMADLAHCYENNSITRRGSRRALRILIFAFTRSCWILQCS